MLQKKIYKKFTETQQFINKAYLEECCKESMLTSYFVVLIIIVNVVMLLYDLLWICHFIQNFNGSETIAYYVR